MAESDIDTAREQAVENVGVHPMDQSNAMDAAVRAALQNAGNLAEAADPNEVSEVTSANTEAQDGGSQTSTDQTEGTSDGTEQQDNEGTSDAGSDATASKQQGQESVEGSEEQQPEEGSEEGSEEDKKQVTDADWIQLRKKEKKIRKQAQETEQWIAEQKQTIESEREAFQKQREAFQARQQKLAELADAEDWDGLVGEMLGEYGIKDTNDLNQQVLKGRAKRDPKLTQMERELQELKKEREEAERKAQEAERERLQQQIVSEDKAIIANALKSGTDPRLKALSDDPTFVETVYQDPNLDEDGENLGEVAARAVSQYESIYKQLHKIFGSSPGTAKKDQGRQPEANNSAGRPEPGDQGSSGEGEKPKPKTVSQRSAQEASAPKEKPKTVSRDEAVRRALEMAG